jgi:hypothetical protein
MEVSAGVWASKKTAGSKVVQRSKNRGLPGREHLIGGLLPIAYDRIAAAFDSLCCIDGVCLPDSRRLMEA